MTTLCRNCGNENPDGAQYCNNCGAKIAPATPPQTTQLKKCPRCGMWNDPNSPICTDCSENLTFVQLTTVNASALAPRYCAWCGTGVSIDEKVCPVCRRDPSGLPPRPRQTLNAAVTAAEASAPTSKLPIAGILLIGAGILEIAAALRVWTTDLSGAGIPAEIDVSGMIAACGTVFFVLGLVALVGSYSALRRDSFVLAISASIAGLLGLGLYSLGSVMSLMALILIVIARGEFRR